MLRETEGEEEERRSREEALISRISSDQAGQRRARIGHAKQCMPLGGSPATAAAMGGKGEEESEMANEEHRVSLKVLARVSSVGAGVQFGWALQLSLLTPYVEELGIPHAWASFIWLCGPISGMFVQPLVGHLSDQCENSWGRRRPFIVSGAAFVVVAVLIIGFSADIGYALGDNLLSRPRAIAVFVFGFWVLDLANNTLQGPCRALLADLTGSDDCKSRRANAFFSLCMAIGNILGYATGAYNGWYRIFPFTMTTACNESCANLKSAFLIAIGMLILTTSLSITAASEVPWSSLMNDCQKSNSNPMVPLLGRNPSTTGLSLAGKSKEVAIAVKEEKVQDDGETFFWEVFTILRDLPRPMCHILLVTALTWFAWFPFILFDTDWMGREVYMGEPSPTNAHLMELYNEGVHAGSLGLMLNSVVLGITSLLIEPLCRVVGQRQVWAVANVTMSACFLGTIIITVLSKQLTDPESGQPPAGLLVSALAIFAILGAPLAVTFSVPYAITTTVTRSAGGGQGLSMGVLNLAVVIPQMMVSVGSGPWDELCGRGNVPAFLLAAVASLVGGILALVLLPKSRSDHLNGLIQYIPLH